VATLTTNEFIQKDQYIIMVVHFLFETRVSNLKGCKKAMPCPRFNMKLKCTCLLKVAQLVTAALVLVAVDSLRCSMKKHIDGSLIYYGVFLRRFSFEVVLMLNFI
jgi:hypothetical protein